MLRAAQWQRTSTGRQSCPASFNCSVGHWRQPTQRTCFDWPWRTHINAYQPKTAVREAAETSSSSMPVCVCAVFDTVLYMCAGASLIPHKQRCDKLVVALGCKNDRHLIAQLQGVPDSTIQYCSPYLFYNMGNEGHCDNWRGDGTCTEVFWIKTYEKKEVSTCNYLAIIR